MWWLLRLFRLPRRPRWNLQALTEHAKVRLPEPVITISKFPFRIGRKHEVQGKGATVFASNDLAVADDKPYQISRNHCSIEREGDHFFVRDRGSTVGTVVNDKPIGLAEDTLTCDLHGGDKPAICMVGIMRSCSGPMTAPLSSRSR
ncbi:MAG: FHA domain-containing protein [Verrucomicrobia bacterium]|nr:FHA domain-containing protein [Verrucomicrobiota bacterium]